MSGWSLSMAMFDRLAYAERSRSVTTLTLNFGPSTFDHGGPTQIPPPGDAITRRLRLLLAIGASVVVVAGIVVGVVLATRPGSPRAVPYTNISRNYKVCLLTDGSDAANTVWPAFQRAAQGRPINAQHITVPAHSSPTPFLNSLVDLHCGLIATSGSDLATSLDDAAQANPRQDYATIGPSTATAPNIRHLSTTDAAEINALLRSACHC